MIRVYLDWNVLSQIKKDRNSELSVILNNKNMFIKFFSTSHIGDILSSYSIDGLNDSLIQSDLDFISDFTDDYCICDDTKKNVIIDNLSPHSLFKDRVEFSNLMDSFISKPFHSLFEDINRHDLIKKMDESFNTPITELDFPDKSSNALLSQAIDLLLPNLEENPTVLNLLKSFNGFLNQMNNDTVYNSLRRMFQEGLNISRDRMYNSNNPIKELESHLKPINYNGIDAFNDHMNSMINKNTPNWFDNYVSTYLNLDMAGFQEDKIEIKNNKRQTFKNTTEDAFHAAFASLCDFYVTNDKKSYRKTNELYKHFNVNTTVLKPNEFVEYYNNYLSIADGEYYINLVLAYLNETKPYIFPNENNVGFFRVYPTAHFIFNYFNRIYVVDFEDQQQPTLLLSKSKPTNGTFIMFKEMNILVKELTKCYGVDIYSDGEFTFEEFNDLDNWKGREWNCSDINLRLKFLNGYLQLYISPAGNIA